MRSDINISDKIEQYLLGQLKGDELVAFNKLLETNPAILQQIEQQKKIMQLVNSGAYLDIKNQIKNIHNNHQKTTIKKGKGLNGKWWVLGIPVLAIVTFIALQKNKQLATSNAHRPTLVADTILMPDSMATFKSKTTTQNALPIEQTHKKKQTGTTQVTANKKPAKSELTPNTNYIAKPGKTTDSIKASKQPKTNTITDSLNLRPDKKPITNTANETVKEQVQEQEQTPKKDSINCNEIEINADVLTNESCNNKPTGSIEIIKSSITGGKPPYMFALDSKKEFVPNHVFTSVKKGGYNVFIRDANKCTEALGAFFVTSYQCDYSAVFAPLHGETWKPPVENLPCRLQVFNKVGIKVFDYLIEFSTEYAWNGTDNSGLELPMGNYLFVLEYENQERFTGNITIVR